MESNETSPTKERDGMLEVFLSNTRSVKGKTTELQFLTTDSDIICLTETHLDDTIPSGSILPIENRTVFRRDRNIYGGGVMIAVCDQLNPKLVDLSKFREEVIAVKIQPQTVICCYYRPCVHLANTEVIDDILEYLQKEYQRHTILFVGDMNFPGIDWSKEAVKPSIPNKRIHQKFLDVLHTHGMTQLVNGSTHVLGNTLDLVCTNQPSDIYNTEIISPGLSDHSLIITHLRTPVSTVSSQPCTVKLYKKVDQEAFQEDMRKTSETLASMDDPEKMWNLFTKNLQRSIDQHVPTKQLKPRHPSIPEWFNKRAMKIKEKIRRAHRKSKLSSDSFDCEQYRELRRGGKKELEVIRKAFYTNRIYQPLKKGNSKPFFKLLKANGNKKPGQIVLKDKHNVLTGDPVQCAELLNAFFQSQFQIGYLAEDFTRVHTDAQDSIDITVEGVAKLIRELPNGKSPGPDGIRKPDMLIDVEGTAKCLALIYKGSLDKGKLPRQWKSANVTPIHKGGAIDSPNNFRPISLTSIPCKMMEHIVLHHLNEKLDSVLHHRQHGFRRGLSCQTQLCATYHELAKAADEGHTTHAIVMDFKKAFDKVPHFLLLQKLQGIPGINTYLLNWILDFLSDRQQSVVLRGVSSQGCRVTSGVPQGSVLGPTLFLCYINDLPDLLSCKVSLYADDTLLYQTVNNNKDAEVFQSDINAVYEWSLKWKMPFNEKKCQAINFGSRTPTSHYKLGTSCLEWVKHTKYLGVIIQSDLKFDQHINDKCLKSRKLLGGIKHLMYDAPKEAKLLAYTSLCRPILEYADVVWDPSAKSKIQDIELVQNSAVRFISNLKGRTDSVSEARNQLQLQSLEERRKNRRLCFLTQILQNEDQHRTLSTTE